MFALAHLISVSLEVFLVLASPAQETFVSNNTPYDVQVCIFLAEQHPFHKIYFNRPIEAVGVIRSKILYRALHGMLAFVISAEISREF